MHKVCVGQARVFLFENTRSPCKVPFSVFPDASTKPMYAQNASIVRRCRTKTCNRIETEAHAEAREPCRYHSTVFLAHVNALPVL